MNTTQVQQHEPPEHNKHTRRKRSLWLRIAVFIVGVLVIAGLTIFNILNTAGGVIAFTAFSALMVLVAYATPLTSDPSPEPAQPQPIQVAVTVQSPPPPQAHSEPTSMLWNVPYPRNLYFTGREGILHTLHEQLTTHQTTALTQRQAICSQIHNTISSRT
ncbi:MAG TPA: hypothetical protein VKT25_07250 [Ktedonobacteraceae bacterium]|nr:hypothetical protein [Ktedonobacteraceae bacterium]